jgi:hypothetical protein
MEAKAGVPVRFSPFTENADAETLRFEQMARSGLEPRIDNLQFKAIPVVGGTVILVRIPRSYRAPHRVIFQGRNKFWARGSNGKYEPNVDGLRALFTRAPALADRMRNFRIDRIAKIVSDDIPVRLINQCCLIVHVVGFSYFDFDVGQIVENARGISQHILPVGMRHPTFSRLNFDGLLNLSHQHSDENSYRSYAQVFRAGAIEGVASDIATSRPSVNIQQIDTLIVQSVENYTKALHHCGIDPPLIAMASIITQQGTVLFTGTKTIWDGADVHADRDQLHLSEVILETVPTGRPQCADFLRPMLDQLANAANLSASPSFDENGNFKHSQGYWF